jgi:S1-C subfamily serine protease
MANLLSSGAGNVKFLAPAGQWGLVVVKEKNDEADGVVVKEVHPGTPAAAAGLKPGDRLLTVDGRWTDTVADLYHAAGHVKPGTEARVTVRRDKQEWTVTIKPRPGL